MRLRRRQALAFYGATPNLSWFRERLTSVAHTKILVVGSTPLVGAAFTASFAAMSAYLTETDNASVLSEGRMGDARVASFAAYDQRFALGSWVASDIGLGGRLFTTEAATPNALVYTPAADVDRMVLYYLPSSADLTISRNGSTVATLSASAGAGDVRSYTIEMPSASKAPISISATGAARIVGLTAYENARQSITFIDASEIGATAKSVSENSIAIEAIKAVSPDLTIICLSANDVASQEAPFVFRDQVTQIAGAAKFGGGSVMLVGDAATSNDTPTSRRPYLDQLAVASMLLGLGDTLDLAKISGEAFGYPGNYVNQSHSISATGLLNLYVIPTLSVLNVMTEGAVIVPPVDPETPGSTESVFPFSLPMNLG